MSTILGKYLIVLGIISTIVGVILVTGGAKFFSWFGRLPGDIRIEGEQSSFYFPITTCILISVILSLIGLILSRLR